MTANPIATAEITNASVNPDSFGRPVVVTTLAATMLAAICPPNEPPIVRIIVLIPVAMPVSDWSTASTTRLAIAANENPIPSPNTALVK